MSRCSVILTLILFCLPGQAFASCLAFADHTPDHCAPQSVFVYVEQKDVAAGQSTVRVAAEIVTQGEASPPSGMPTHFVIRRGQDVTVVTAPAHAGVALVDLPVGWTAGLFEVFAIAGRVRSAVQYVEVLPGSPAPFSVRLPRCDDEMNCEVLADDLTDRFGNRLVDGLSGRLLTYVGEDLVSQEAIQVLRGAVSTSWQRPNDDSVIVLKLGSQTAQLKVAGR